MAEAMSETSASSWYDDTPITDEQIESVRHSLLMPTAERGAAFAPFVVRKMLTEIDRLRADQPPPTDEYGMRITYVSTLTEEGAIADTLAGALEALAAFDAKGRDDVLSRKLRVRKVGQWQDIEEGDDRG